MQWVLVFIAHIVLWCRWIHGVSSVHYRLMAEAWRAWAVKVKISSVMSITCTYVIFYPLKFFLTGSTCFSYSPSLSAYFLTAHNIHQFLCQQLWITGLFHGMKQWMGGMEYGNWQFPIGVNYLAKEIDDQSELTDCHWTWPTIEAAVLADGSILGVSSSSSYLSVVLPFFHSLLFTLPSLFPPPPPPILIPFVSPSLSFYPFPLFSILPFSSPISTTFLPYFVLPFYCIFPSFL